MEEDKPKTEFSGHASIGIFTWLMATWWIVNIYKSITDRNAKRRKPFRAQAYYKGPIYSFPVESAVKVIGGIIVIIGEIVATKLDNNKSLSSFNYQHMTMKSAVLLSGILDIVHYKKMYPMDGLEPVGGLVVHGTVAFLLHFHFHGLTQVELLLHRLYVVNNLIAMGCIFYEIWHKNVAICSIARAVVSLTLGTWITHTGIILDSEYFGLEPWNDNDPKEIRQIHILFIWHFLANAIFTIILGFIVSKLRKKTN